MGSFIVIDMGPKKNIDVCEQSRVGFMQLFTTKKMTNTCLDQKPSTPFAEIFNI